LGVSNDVIKHGQVYKNISRSVVIGRAVVEFTSEALYVRGFDREEKWFSFVLGQVIFKQLRDLKMTVLLLLWCSALSIWEQLKK